MRQIIFDFAPNRNTFFRQLQYATRGLRTPLRQVAQPAQLATAHGSVIAFFMVVSAREMIHAVRNVQQKLFRHGPALPLRRSPESLIRVDEQFAQKSWRLWGNGVIRLRNNIRRAINAHYRAMYLFRSGIVNKMDNNFMPRRIAHPRARTFGKKLCGFSHLCFFQAELRRQRSSYGNFNHAHNYTTNATDKRSL